MMVVLKVIMTILVAFIGLILGAGLDSYFNNIAWSFSPVLAIVFAIATIGGFIIAAIEKKK